MKRYVKIILLLFVGLGFAEGVSAQHHVGFRVGYGGGTARFEPKEEMEYLFGWPSFGVSWKYYSPHRVVGGIQMDLQMVKKGYRMLSNGILVNDQIEYQDFYERTLSAIELPFMWQPHLYVFNRKGRIYMNLGIYLSYIYESSYKQGKIDGDIVTSEGEYTMHSYRDNNFEYGLCGGFGFSYMFNRFEVFAEARYNFGYSDILKARSKYPENRYSRTPVDMLNVSMGFYYRFGKGGILAPPAPKERVKMGSWDDMPPAPKDWKKNSGGNQGQGQGRQQIPGREDQGGMYPNQMNSGNQMQRF